MSKLTYFVLVVIGDRDEENISWIDSISNYNVSVTYIYAEEWSELTGLLDDSLQLVKRNEDEKAVQVLQHFSEQFVIKGNEKKQEVTPDQVRVISLAYDKAKQSLAEEEVSKQVKIDNVLALQLAVDAQVSEVPTTLDGKRRKSNGCLFSNGKSDDKRRYRTVSTNVKHILHEFNIIYPSLMIALPENRSAACKCPFILFG